MTTQEVADRLVELCRKGDFIVALKELYAEDAVSIEPYEIPGFDKETKGLPNMLKKADLFESMIEARHSQTVSEPLVCKTAITFKLTMELTMKGKERSRMEELCVYQLRDGKIISEQFFE